MSRMQQHLQHQQQLQQQSKQQLQGFGSKKHLKSSGSHNHDLAAKQSSTQQHNSMATTPPPMPTQATSSTMAKAKIDVLSEQQRQPNQLSQVQQMQNQGQLKNNFGMIHSGEQTTPHMRSSWDRNPRNQHIFHNLPKNKQTCKKGQVASIISPPIEESRQSQQQLAAQARRVDEVTTQLQQPREANGAEGRLPMELFDIDGKDKEIESAKNMRSVYDVVAMATGADAKVVMPDVWKAAEQNSQREKPLKLLEESYGQNDHGVQSKVTQSKSIIGQGRKSRINDNYILQNKLTSFLNMPFNNQQSKEAFNSYLNDETVDNSRERIFIKQRYRSTTTQNQQQPIGKHLIVPLESNHYVVNQHQIASTQQAEIHDKRNDARSNAKQIIGFLKSQNKKERTNKGTGFFRRSTTQKTAEDSNQLGIPRGSHIHNDSGLHQSDDEVQEWNESPNIRQSRMSQNVNNLSQKEQLQMEVEIMRQKIQNFERKQLIKDSKKKLLQKKKYDELNRDKLKYRIKKCIKFFICHKDKQDLQTSQRKSRRLQNLQKQSKGDMDVQKEIELMYQVKKVMQQRCEEQVQIDNARKLWTKVRKSKRILQMMHMLGEEQVIQLINARKDREKIMQKKEKRISSMFVSLLDSGIASKLIIPPKNYWYMVINNISVVIFLIYMVMFPLYVSFDKYLTEENFINLVMFDMVFIFDRILDLFVGYYKEDGQLESSLARVIQTNMSMKILFEIFMTFGPIVVSKELGAISFAIFKLPRWLRLFELQQRADEFVEYFRENKTLSEIKYIRKQLQIYQFCITTMINLHFLTCMQIALCKHRENYEQTWMGGQGVGEQDSNMQYIIAIYFVTTTLSTCGFGDIFATRRDRIETFVVLMLQFVGLLFYSLTIQKVQSFMISDDVIPNEYSNQQVEAVENLIVKAEPYLPKGEKIPGKDIESWKDYTFKYFQYSPRFFLADNDIFKGLSSNLQVRVVKKNLMLEFQEQFDIFFMDPEFGFKADDLLITRVIASIAYQHVEPGKSLITLGEVSNAIFFIQQGMIEVSYPLQDKEEDQELSLLIYEQGSYVGDTSLIFGIRNKYNFRIKKDDQNQPIRIYNLEQQYIDEMFQDFPQFKRMLQIRALRRHHYLRKIKKQQLAMHQLRNNGKFGQNGEMLWDVSLQMLEMKKARLVEESMNYEELVMEDNFSDDEITATLNRRLIKERIQLLCLQQVRRMERQFRDLVSETGKGMQAVIETIQAIDDQSKKILYKEFKNQNVNMLARHVNQITNNIQEIANEQSKLNMKVFSRMNTGNLSSDSSGNESENDQINKIYQLQKHYSQSNSQVAEMYEGQELAKRQYWRIGSMIDEDDFEDPSQDSNQGRHARKDTFERELEEIDQDISQRMMLKQVLQSQQSNQSNFKFEADKSVDQVKSMKVKKEQDKNQALNLDDQSRSNVELLKTEEIIRGNLITNPLKQTISVDQNTDVDVDIQTPIHKALIGNDGTNINPNNQIMNKNSTRFQFSTSHKNNNKIVDQAKTTDANDKNPNQLASMIEQQQISSIYQKDESNYLLIPVDFQYEDQNNMMKQSLKFSKHKDMAKTQQNYNRRKDQGSTQRGVMMETNGLQILQQSVNYLSGKQRSGDIDTRSNRGQSSKKKLRLKQSSSKKLNR